MIKTEAEKLKNLIIDRLDCTVTQLSKETGVSRPTIDNIIKGKHLPSLLTCKKICAYFGVNFRDYI